MLFKRGLNVDLSHSVPTVRAGILQIARDLGTTSLVSYSHGASAADIARDSYFSSSAEKRGLQPEEVDQIIKGGGIIGLGVSRPFFQSLDHLAEAIDRICQKENGPASLGLGTDFGGVSPMLLIDGVKNAGDLAIIGDILARRFGYNEAKIQAILSQNVHDWSEKLK
jgi:microsomal dipeptidase-like Zn-dependent dipeptidase